MTVYTRSTESAWDGSTGRFAAASGSTAPGYTPRRPHGSSPPPRGASGADRDDVIDLAEPPPTSRIPNLADVAVTLGDSLPDPSPMAVIAEAAVLTDTHVSPSS